MLPKIPPRLIVWRFSRIPPTHWKYQVL